GTVRFRTEKSLRNPGLGFLAESKVMVAATGMHSRRFWEAATGKLLRELDTANLAIRAFALSPNSKYFAVAGILPSDNQLPPAGAIIVKETASGKIVRTFPRTDSDVAECSMALSSDGKVLVSLGRDM